MFKRWVTAPVEGTAEDFLEQAGERQFSSGKKAWWHSLFYGCAACVGGAAGHAGCLVAPLVTAATSGAIVTAGHSPLLMIGSGLAINTVTLGLWYRFRGRFVSTPIKAATIGFAVAGMIVTTGLNLKTHLQEHSPAQAEAWFKAQSPEAQKNIKEVATAWHMDVDTYLTTFELCGGPIIPANFY
jgi:hypothetical protein